MLSLGLNLLGIGKHLLGWVSGAFKWLFAKWYRVALLVSLTAFLWAFTGKLSETKRADRNAEIAKSEKKLRIANEVTYRNAQKVAADLNRHQIKAIKERYDAIATETENEYEKRLADNRAALRQWMRTKAAPSIAQSTGAGSSTEMPAQVVPRAEEALVPVADLEIAADNYSQLVSLIEWAKKVGEVKP